MQVVLKDIWSFLCILTTVSGDHPGEYKDFLYEPNINFYRNGSLQFLHISKESEGHYLCEAKNEIGTGVSKVIFLKVNGECFKNGFVFVLYHILHCHKRINYLIVKYISS